MDKSKLIAVVVLVGIGGALLYSKAQDPAAPGGEEAGPQPTAIANVAPDESAKPEADTTELKIIDQRVGTGPTANTGDALSMNYKGTLLNGKIFDQSYGREPFDFQLGAGQVIEGWDKGIVGMKVGGKRKLVIPASMAYKDQDKGDIPPNSTLVFDVELLSVNGKTS